MADTANTSTDDADVEPIVFSNNRVGSSREEEPVSPSEFVRRFLDHDASDPKNGPFAQRLRAFILDYENGDGLKLFSPLSREQMRAINDEYNRQRS